MANNEVISTKNLSLDLDYRLDPDYISEELGRCLNDNFRDNYLLKELLTKLPRNGYSADVRAENAIAKMLESEATCAAINQFGYGFRTPRDYHASVMLYAQRLCAEILGDFSYDIFRHASFSSGATVSRKRKFGDAYYKYHSTRPVSTTPGCYNYSYALISATPLWCSMGAWDNITLSIGNDVTTVPKKTEIDRTIAKEPCLNMALQRSVGRHIRARLKLYGIDLNSQERNQKLAFKGSVDGTLATIDLAAASDSISRRFVQDLVPIRWYDEMDKLRSHYGTLPNGDVIMWEKFSSMGNGFTFELESLLFYCIIASVAKIEGFRANDTCVYGDDIIVPTAIARNVINVLDDFGFKTNIDKTFIDGPFRESCGKHYYNGIDVSPFYIRSRIDSVPRVIWFLNSLRKWATLHQLVDPRVFELWASLKRRFVPRIFLGGRDFENQGAVVSPEFPRKLLILSPRIKRIDGMRALLRYFQYNIVDDEDGQLGFQPLQYSRANVFNKYKASELSWGRPPKWRDLPDNDIVQYVSVPSTEYNWWRTKPLFPQEIVE